MLVGQIPTEEHELCPWGVATDLLTEEHPVAVIGGGDADDVVVVAGDVEENLAEGQLCVRGLHAGIEPGKDVAGLLLVERGKPEDRAVVGAGQKPLLAVTAGGHFVGIANLRDPGGEGIGGAIIFRLDDAEGRPAFVEQGDLRFPSVGRLEIAYQPLPHRLRT